MTKVILGEPGKRMQRRKDFRLSIISKMAGRYTQSKLGHELGITQPAMRRKIQNLQLGYEDLVSIFALLDFSDAEILEAMKK